jgi:hypothetical protein
VHLIERALETQTMQTPQVPRRLGAAAPVGEPQVIVDVITVAIIGLDALHAELQHPLGRLPPPRLRGAVREVDRGAGAHPPPRDERLTARLADEVPDLRGRRVVGRGLAVETL